MYVFTYGWKYFWFGLFAENSPETCRGRFPACYWWVSGCYIIDGTWYAECFVGKFRQLISILFIKYWLLRIWYLYFRGLTCLPPEVIQFGAHVEEIYLKGTIHIPRHHNGVSRSGCTFDTSFTFIKKIKQYKMLFYICNYETAVLAKFGRHFSK